MAPLGTARRVVAVLRENLATFVAGSLAYSAFLSVLPLLTLAAVVATAVGEQRLVDQALRLTGTYATPTGRELFGAALRDDTERAALSVVSLLVLLWSGLRVFRGLDVSFSLFYGTARSQGPVERVHDALVVFASLAAALLVALGVGVASPLRAGTPLGWLLGSVLLLAPLVVAFLPMYYVFPNAGVTVREVLPGVLVAALGWTVLQRAFRLYARHADAFEVYGSLGATFMVLTWLYVASLLLLVGVAVNVVLAGRTAAALADAPAESVAPREE